jgi:NADPH:quinone reductase-like Zn-dependent oxidoreductase
MRGLELETSDSMKSARIHAFTENPEEIDVVDVAKPTPAAGQVRVRMLMSPVNPSDLNLLHGTYRQALERVVWNHGKNDPSQTVFYDPTLRNTCPMPPYALGGEGVGIVDGTGSGFLARRLLGKRVALASGPPNGTWQEYTVVDAKRAIALPDAISSEQGAMYFVNPITAYVLIREVLRVPRGRWLLVTAAGSALGKSAVRLGKLYGFKTLCVVRGSANTQELRDMGADAVVETSNQNLQAEVFRITQGKGVGYAIDCVGGELAADVLRCLGLDGHMVLYGTLDKNPMPLTVRDLMMPVARVSGFLLPNWMAQQSPLKLLSVLRAVKKLTVQGVFETEVAEVYTLDQVADAVRAASRPGRTGKVMLRMASA